MYRNQEVTFGRFQDEFTAFMERTMRKDDVLLVLGDFNVWIEVEENQEARKMKTLMNAYGLSQRVKDPTHRGGHTLDHVYVNEQQIELEHEVIKVSLGLTTDHLPIIIKIPSPSIHKKAKESAFRKNERCRHGKFQK